MTAVQGNITIVSSCPYRWKRHGKYCYYFSDENTSWTNALWNCINEKAYLVSILSDEEQVMMFQLQLLAACLVVLLSYVSYISYVSYVGPWWLRLLNACT
uniref:C-type lectin domain-containing protein n=1 Tax=Naja naja TaxID=35670 RepID=A0A8C7DXM5_NAJNA